MSQIILAMLEVLLEVDKHLAKQLSYVHDEKSLQLRLKVQQAIELVKESI